MSGDDAAAHDDDETYDNDRSDDINVHHIDCADHRHKFNDPDDDRCYDVHGRNLDDDPCKYLYGLVKYDYDVFIHVNNLDDHDDGAASSGRLPERR